VYQPRWRRIVNDFALRSAAERAAGNGAYFYSRIVPIKGGFALYQRRKNQKESEIAHKRFMNKHLKNRK
jgi:hypothetical protein